MALATSPLLTSDFYANYYYGQQNQLLGSILSNAGQSSASGLSSTSLVNLLGGLSGSLLDNTANSLLAFSAKLDSLAVSANAMTSDANSGIFAGRVAVSNNGSNVSATAQNGARLATYLLDVSQLATAQQVQSNALNSTATGIAPGTYTIGIQMGNLGPEQVSFTVNSGDTNGTVLANLARAFNFVPPLVNGQVVGGTGGTQRLQLTAIDTGIDNTLTLTDVSGNLLSQLGITTAASATSTLGGVSQVAGNALYKLNGASYSSDSNQVALDANSQATLLATGSSTISVSVQPNASTLSGAINTFVSRYNDALTFGTSLKVPSIFLSALTATTQAFQGQLASIGITFNSDTTLSINQAQLSSAIVNQFRTVQGLFNGDSGLAATMGLAATASAATVNEQNNIQGTTGSILGPSFGVNPQSAGFSPSTSPFSFGLLYDAQGGLILPNFQNLFTQFI